MGEIAGRRPDSVGFFAPVEFAKTTKITVSHRGSIWESLLHKSLALFTAVLLLLISLNALTPWQDFLIRASQGGWTMCKGMGLGCDGNDTHNNNNTDGNLADVNNISSTAPYLIGVGKADITGPVVEINLMGYADPKQVGTGLRQRLYSRAFIVSDPNKPTDRFVYLVLDTQSGDTAVRYGILDELRKMGAEYAVYGHQNVAVTGTHSHSGPGGWLNYLLPQITSKGFDQQGFRAIVDGAVLSIRRAHESLAPGYLDVASTRVHGANINRSLFAYLANPAAERARYNHTADTGSSQGIAGDEEEGVDDGSVDKALTLVKFQRASDNKNIGVLTWFATHGTSMLGNNTLVTGDNKGVAADLFEKSVLNCDSGGTGCESFVAGFSQSNVGDVSPNVLGAWCEDGTGLPCSFENSTCSDGKAQQCHARGPLFRMDNTGTASCFEIGRRQFTAARMLYDRLLGEPHRVGGKPTVKAFHTFHNMSGFEFELANSTIVRTCPAALGYSFAAGTSDGPGAVNFTQHDSDPSNTSPVWRAVSHLLKTPSEKQQACHHPKPILLDVGELTMPYAWTPNVVDVQVLRVGHFVIVVSPGEASTMAGRRWRDAVAEVCTDLFLAEEIESERENEVAPFPIVVLGGPANSYTHYITTEEEYGVQRYEGASTLYGPHTLAAYINITLSLLPHLSADMPITHDHHDALALSIDADPFPPDNSNRSLSFITGVVRDAPPLFRSFGDVLEDVRGTYLRGEEVRTHFVGANPRNNLRLEGTFAAVEKMVGNGPEDRIWNDEKESSWMTVRDDSDWGLVYYWRRTSEILATSEVEIVWETEDWAEPGIYRIRYYGDAKALGGTITPFEGVTRPFVLE